MLTVYLCGPIQNCTDSDCKDWRQHCIKNLNANCLDPMVRDYRGIEITHQKEIVENDKIDIDNSDILIVNYIKPSVGTSMEILYAWERSKKIFIVTPETNLSPWMLYHSHKIFKSFDEIIDYINSL